MFVRTLSAPKIKLSGVEVQLSAGLPGAISRHIRTETASEIGAALKAEDPGKLRHLYQRTLDERADCRRVIDALESEADDHRDAVSTLKSGEISSRSDLCLAAADAYGYCKLIAREQPDAAVATSLLGETVASMEDAADAIDKGVETGRERLEKSDTLLEKLAVGLFAFDTGTGGLIADKVQQHLPDPLRALIDPRKDYGRATQDQFGSDEDINASVLVNRIRRHVTGEARRAKDAETKLAAAKRRARVKELLRDVHRG